jgi:hypothetical protein
MYDPRLVGGTSTYENIGQNVNQAFEQELGRPAGPGGLEYYGEQLLQGRPMGAIQQEIANSPEARGVTAPPPPGPSAGIGTLRAQQFERKMYDRGMI